MELTKIQQLFEMTDLGKGTPFSEVKNFKIKKLAVKHEVDLKFYKITL